MDVVLGVIVMIFSIVDGLVVVVSVVVVIPVVPVVVLAKVDVVILVVVVMLIVAVVIERWLMFFGLCGYFAGHDGLSQCGCGNLRCCCGHGGGHDGLSQCGCGDGNLRCCCGQGGGRRRECPQQIKRSKNSKRFYPNGALKQILTKIVDF